MVRQLKDLCKTFDPDGSGAVSRTDFKQCISADRCDGLTKAESKQLLTLLPKDSQGNIIYRKLGAGLEQVIGSFPSVVFTTIVYLVEKQPFYRDKTAFLLFAGFAVGSQKYVHAALRCPCMVLGMHAPFNQTSLPL